MKSLDNFSSFEISNTEEVQGGTFGLLSMLCAPKTTTCQPAPCYTPPPTSCTTGGYTNPCAPKTTTCLPTLSFSFSLSLGICK